MDIELRILIFALVTIIAPSINFILILLFMVSDIFNWRKDNKKERRGAIERSNQII